MARGQFARRVGAALLKQQRRQASSSGGPFWSDGKQTGHNGYLFNETPPPPGESRVMEGWEMPWYIAFGSATIILGVGLNSKPNTSLSAWAREEAKKDLAAKA